MPTTVTAVMTARMPSRRAASSAIPRSSRAFDSEVRCFAAQRSRPPGPQGLFAMEAFGFIQLTIYADSFIIDSGAADAPPRHLALWSC